MALKLGSNSVALDFVYDRNKNPWILEVSYGFIKEVCDSCEGYWDRELIWHKDQFNPQGWIVDCVLQRMSQ